MPASGSGEMLGPMKVPKSLVSRTPPDSSIFASPSAPGAAWQEGAAAGPEQRLAGRRIALKRGDRLEPLLRHRPRRGQHEGCGRTGDRNQAKSEGQPLHGRRPSWAVKRMPQHQLFFRR